MKILDEIPNGNRSLRMQWFPSFLLVLLLLITSCNNRPQPYSILEFTGKGGVFNYSKSLNLMSHESDSVNPTALLASNGDLIMFDNDKVFYYRESSQNKFSFKSVNKADYINEKIISINIPDNDDMIPWFKQMKSIDISALDYLKFESPIPESYFPYLTDLAKIKPDIGLGCYKGGLKDMEKLFKIFNPRFIIGGTLSRKDYNMLSGLTNLELLMVSLSDSIYTIPLPAMPRLKQLILTDNKDDVILSDDFLINNKQLERLIICESGKFNFLLIRPLDNLKELVIWECDTLENFDLIKNHKHLEVLSITGEKFKYDPALNELADLRWMTFSSNVTQNEFNSFVDNHPDLEVVEIIKNDVINSLQPLLKLRKFYGLAITDTLTDIVTINSLKNLKYLSLPDVVLKDSTKKAELQKLLPDTRIVANHGFCLGSGWLLLIIPLILLFRVFTQKKSGKIQDRI